MPRGRYSLHDPHDHTPLGEEHFQCAPGPSGWRYVSQITAPSGDHVAWTITAWPLWIVYGAIVLAFLVAASGWIADARRGRG